MKNKRLFLLPCTLFLTFAIASCGSQSHTPNSNNSSSSTQSAWSVSGVYLSYDALTMYLGKTATLKATIEPETATNKSVTWSSSDTSVATVKEGTISALKVGTTNITVTTVEGGFTATCALTVIEEEEEEPYEPNTQDSSIFFATNDTLSNATYDSSKEEYTFSVNQNYKQIYVNVPDKTVVLELNGVTIENNENSPVYVEDCENVEISAKKNTTNNIKDTRPNYATDQAGQGKGAIFVSNGDLKLKGTGTLNITANYLNGIHVKDDVKIQKLTLNVNAVNHGIRGNDSVEIVSGTINVSCGGDGLHTENSDVSSKGNQKGDVTINGGSLTVNSWSDAVQAAHDVVFEELDTATPINFVAKTNKYSSYSGDTIETSSSNLYLRMNSSTYSNGSYTYAALINAQWYKATYKGTQSSGGQGGPGGGGGGFPGGGGGPGGSSTYYIYQLEKPANATSFTLYRFQGNNVTVFSADNYNAVSDAKAFNDAYDMVTISVSSKKISFSNWGNYASGNSNGADISAKGLKAENEIYVKSGNLDIKAYDDAIHANNDGSLENGKSPLGNVNISGGYLKLNASDDGIHADNIVNISGGETHVESAYEGIEGNVINVSNGSTYVYATDDGMNATKGNTNAAINVSGGLLDVEVPTNGDTDGIDSNGSFTQTGGVVIVKGPGTAGSSSFGAAALDTDGNVSLKDCTLIVYGGIEKTPSTNNVTKTLCTSNSVTAGSHTVSFSGGTSYITTLKSASRGCVVYSLLGSATLK